ncbi:MAG: hypothetical protein ACJA2O_004162, partial [Candidatus Azotimanducaceae bacterium]
PDLVFSRLLIPVWKAALSSTLILVIEYSLYYLHCLLRETLSL